MTAKQIRQISILVIISIVLNIVLYSKLGLGLRFTLTNPLITALLAAEIVGNIAIFIYVSYKIFLRASTTQLYDTAQFINKKDYENALEDCKSKKIFADNIKDCEKQIERIEEKCKTIDIILLQHFNKESMTYEKFMNSVNTVKHLFYANLKNIISRMSVFNEAEYKELIYDSNRNDINLEIYREHISYINDTIADNNIIISKLNNLILEISKLDDNNFEFEHLQIMEEMNDLINKTKLYK